MPRTRTALIAAAAAAYVGTVVLANVLVERVGVIDVGFGRQAPAAVLAVGLTLVVRDVLHEATPARHRPAVLLAAIAAGTALSAILAGPRLVAASACAFLLAELVDLGVYAPLRRRGFAVAALVSSAAGLVVDSLLFLELAPQLIPGLDNRALLAGQLIGKAEAVVAAVLLLEAARRARRA